MATAATATRKAKRVVRRARTAETPRRVARQATRTARTGAKIGIATLATLGVIIALGATALVIAAVDPRAEEYLRRGAREAGDAARGWASRLPDRRALEHVGHQLAETGQRLAHMVRAQG
ncbi:MAG TPA: hypothetical protein VGG48_17665 [Rhizomicrobium sp.]|jgi:hypothetical protein